MTLRNVVQANVVKGARKFAGCFVMIMDGASGIATGSAPIRMHLRSPKDALAIASTDGIVVRLGTVSYRVRFVSANDTARV